MAVLLCAYQSICVCVRGYVSMPESVNEHERGENNERKYFMAVSACSVKHFYVNMTHKLSSNDER